MRGITSDQIQYWVVLIIVLLEKVIPNIQFWKILSDVGVWCLSLYPKAENILSKLLWCILKASTNCFEVSAWCYIYIYQVELEKFVKGDSAWSSYLFYLSTHDILIFNVNGSQSISRETKTILQTFISSWVGNKELNPPPLVYTNHHWFWYQYLYHYW